MKIPLLLALAGLAISFAVPAIAQQKDTADPQHREALAAYNKKEDEARNNNDAVALAALYTEDAVLVNDTGPIYGRDAIEKHYADVFKQVHLSNHIETGDQYSLTLTPASGVSGTLNPCAFLRKAFISFLFKPALSWLPVSLIRM